MSDRKRVVVAMSGGVDSSLAAALLRGSGYDVIGVTMQIWSPSLPAAEREGGCCSLSAVEDARRVADIIGIPYYVLNFYDIFTKEVVDYFVNEYGMARTPNPCIRCNQKVKFEALLAKALALGADHIATGHYARAGFDEAVGRWYLERSGDRRKDQTYALYQMTQDQLARTLFPLGDHTKDEVRDLAAKYGLPVADKPDSQEICFIPDNDYRGFLNEYVPDLTGPGPIYNEEGKQIGVHGGLGFYTVGQRKGLGSDLGEKLYVKALDKARNALIVGPNESLFEDALIADEISLVSVSEITPGMEVTAKIRYSAPEEDARLYPMEDGTVKCCFRRPVRAITPGQAVVFYSGDRVAGGGTIASSVSGRHSEKQNG